MLFVPVGGLANRMRATASAVALAERCGTPLRVVWFQDWALHAPFGALFQPWPEGKVQIVEAGWTDLLLYDRPRRRNFWLPALWQRLHFHTCLYEGAMGALRASQYPFEECLRHGSLYAAACIAFTPYPVGQMQRLFRPLPALETRIARRVESFAPYTIGVHVRRTDNMESVRQSPMSLFFQAIDEELALHEEMAICLTTDDQEVKRQMRQRYGCRVLCVEEEARRGNVEGIQDAVVDLYTLSRTDRIIGSFHSSFSELAAELGNIPLQIMRQSHP